MTRTARAAYPRAVIKDRSESRTGTYDMARKSGAGQHNWGSLADERQLESAALDDALLDEEDGEEPTPAAAAAADLASSTSSVQCALSIPLHGSHPHICSRPTPSRLAAVQACDGAQRQQRHDRRGARAGAPVPEERAQGR